MNNPEIKKIMILAVSFLSGMCIFLTVLLYILLNDGVTFITGVDNSTVLVCAAIGISCMPAGLFIYRNLVEKSRVQQDPDERLRALRTAIIIRSAIWEAGVLINCIALIMNHSWISLIVSGAIILEFLVFFPTPVRIQSELDTKY